MIKLRRCATWTFIGVIGVNAAGLISLILLQMDYQGSSREMSLKPGDRFPAFSGVDVRGVKWEPKVALCRLIRITDDNCEYCKKDAATYETLVVAAVSASCEVVELSPLSGGLSPTFRPGAVQLEFIDADIGSSLFPFATPQTVLLDGGWNVQMTVRGVMDADALSSAINTIKVLSSSAVR